MSRERELLTELISSLKQQRDELALQIHLGKAEAKEEWEKVQAKLDKLATDAEPLKQALEESTENVLVLTPFFRCALFGKLNSRLAASDASLVSFA